MQNMELAHACTQVACAVAYSADDGIAASACGLSEGLPEAVLRVAGGISRDRSRPSTGQSARNCQKADFGD